MAPSATFNRDRAPELDVKVGVATAAEQHRFKRLAAANDRGLVGLALIGQLPSGMGIFVFWLQNSTSLVA